MTKLLTVFGATGKQGGSVIETVLADYLSQEFKIRAVTRDPSSTSAKALAAKGVEVVKADLNDPASVAAAIAGSHTVFAVTNFWESLSKATEVAQGRNIADAAKKHNVQHLIWSALPNVTKATDGKLPHVEHFDGKAEIDEYIRELGVPMTSFVPGFYFENLKSMHMIAKGDDGVYRLTWPVPASTRFPFFYATGDTGKFVAGIIQTRTVLLNGRVPAASGWWSGQDVVDTFQEVTGKKAEYVQVDGEDWKKASGLGEKIGQEMLENFLLIRDYKYFATEEAESEVEEAINLLTLPPKTLKEYLDEETW